MVVSVLINTSVKKLNKVYDYLVKAEDEQNVVLGKRVKVNFGKRNAEGIIVKIQNSEYVPKFKLKVVEEILDVVSYVDESKLKLAKWMAYMYFCNVYDALKLMLPAGSNNLDKSKKLEAKFELIASLNFDEKNIEEYVKNKIISSAKQEQVLRFLAENKSVNLKEMLSFLRYY